MDNLASDLANVNLDGEAPQVHPERITPEYVMGLTRPTDKFLCKLADNWPKFRFGGFKIRDMLSKITLVDVPDQGDEQLSDDDDPSTRVIKYHLGPDFLKLRTVGLTLNFSIGPKEIKTL